MDKIKGSMVQALRTDALDVVVALTEGLISDMVHTSPTYRIVTQYTESPLEWGIAVRSGTEKITGLSDLNKKRFGVSRLGSGSHLMAILLAQKQGWDMPSFVIVGGLADLIKALEEDLIDAFLWETTMLSPFGSIFQIDTIESPWPCFMFAVQDALLHDPHSLQTIKKIIFLVRNQCSEFMRNVSQSIPLITQSCHVSEVDALRWFNHTQFTHNDSDSADDVINPQSSDRLLNIVTQTAEILQQAGIISLAPSDPSSLIFNP